MDNPLDKHFFVGSIAGNGFCTFDKGKFNYQALASRAEFFHRVQSVGAKGTRSQREPLMPG
jgi:hypothetical protein